MHNYSTELLGCQDMQEFVDTGIQDPAKLEAIRRKSRRPVRRSPWLWWYVTGAAVVTALVLGLLIGRLLP